MSISPIRYHGLTLTIFESRFEKGNNNCDGCLLHGGVSFLIIMTYTLPDMKDASGSVKSGLIYAFKSAG